MPPRSAWSPRGHQAVTSGSIMPTEHHEAARAIVKRRHVPDLFEVDRGQDLAIVAARARQALPARSSRGHRSVTDVVATLKARVAELETELAQAEERSAGHRVDFEREHERADQLVTTLDRTVAELEALRSLLEAAQQAAPPVTPPGPRIWRDMTWREMIRWLNRCAPFWKPRRLPGGKPRSRLLGRSPPEHGAR